MESPTSAMLRGFSRAPSGSLVAKALRDSIDTGRGTLRCRRRQSWFGRILQPIAGSGDEVLARPVGELPDVAARLRLEAGKKRSTASARASESSSPATRNSNRTVKASRDSSVPTWGPASCHPGGDGQAGAPSAGASRIPMSDAIRGTGPRRASTRQVFLRYLAFEAPSWVLLAAVLAVLMRVWDLSLALAALVLALWIVKDLALFPILRIAYEPAGGSGGAENLIGALGIVSADLDPEGWVRIGAERWRARVSREHVSGARGPARSRVRVTLAWLAIRRLLGSRRRGRPPRLATRRSTAGTRAGRSPRGSCACSLRGWAARRAFACPREKSRPGGGSRC